MEKLFVFDLETTGLKAMKNGIHQISALIIIDGEVKEELNFHLKPFAEDVVEDSALQVAGITQEDLKLEKYRPAETTYQELLAVLGKYVDKYNKKDKFHLCGYNNAGFDNQFFRAFFTKNNDKYFGSWFWSDSVDVMVLASYFLRKERAKLEDFKLKTVSQYLGISIDESKLHNATYDLYLTYNILKTIENKK